MSMIHNSNNNIMKKMEGFGTLKRLLAFLKRNDSGQNLITKPIIKRFYYLISNRNFINFNDFIFHLISQ